MLLDSPLRPLWDAFKRLFRVDRRRNMVFYAYDESRFWKFSGAWGKRGRESMLAELSVSFHVIEKGLTMPNRHLGFGISVVKDLMRQIEEFVTHYGSDDVMVEHAIGVVKSYWLLHCSNCYKFDGQGDFEDRLKLFVERYPNVTSATQPHFTHSQFYATIDAPFPEFAAGRHTIRHFALNQPISAERIEHAVSVAQTAPSACNRQHGRIYCVTNHEKCRRILDLQGGNRGFGHLADKVLIVVADLEDILLPRERNDAFVNGGIFLMNLCYALHYDKIAHCAIRKKLLYRAHRANWRFFVFSVK